MAITYPLSLPQVRRNGAIITFSSLKMTAVSNVALSSSIWTYKQFVQTHSGEMWRLSATLPVLTEEEASPWIAWIISLKGQYGTFMCGDPSRATPIGSALGSPVVASAVNKGNSTITTSGWTANQPKVLCAGDYIQIGTHLHMILEDAASGSAGTAVLSIFPSLRENVSANTQIIVNEPKGIFRLGNDSVEYSVSTAHHYSISISAL